MAKPEFDETAELIPSSKVEGAPVFGSDGEALGHVHALMVNKRSGQVTHAVLKTGGVMGFGAQYQLLPWSSLDFDGDLDGYVAESDDDPQKPASGPSAASHFNYAYGTEPIGHYGLDGPEEPAK